jgi:hypothetical protein
MIDVRSFWPGVTEWMTQIIEIVRTLDPAILVLLAAPCIIALACMSLTAFALTLLLAATALVAFRAGAGEPFRWSIAALTFAAGLLAVLQAVMLRRKRRRVREMEAALREARRELGEVREKYENEVYWRRAGERVVAQQTE